MKKWLCLLLGPFFLLATAVALILPYSCEAHYLLASSLIMGVVTTYLLYHQTPEKASEEQPIPHAEFIPEENSVMKRHANPPSKKPESRESFEARYLQLRKQFSEKNAILHRTRQELFRVENQLMTLQKASEESRFEEDSYVKEMERYVAQIAELTVEIDVLYSMFEKQPKKSRRKPKNNEPIDDFLSSLM